jgi:hypothetical protein
VRPEPQSLKRIPLKRTGDVGHPPPRRRQRVGLIAGRSADRRRWLGAPLARTRGKWQREGQRGSFVRPERPSSIVRPEPNFSKMESAWAANRRRQRVAPLTDCASMDKDERERGPVCGTVSVRFRSGHWRRPRTSLSSTGDRIIIVRPDRPSSSVRRESQSLKRIR